jgi:hypothetical protein
MELLQAIRAVAAGGVYLDPAMTSRVADGLLARHAEISSQPHAVISERESEMLRLTAIGHSNKKIASQLKISVKTVESPQGECHAEARIDWPSRHHPIWCPSRLALRYLIWSQPRGRADF